MDKNKRPSNNSRSPQRKAGSGTGRPSGKPARQTPSAGRASVHNAAGEPSRRPAKKKKGSRGRQVVIILLVVLIVLIGLFLFFMGRYIYQQIATPKKGNDVDLTSYDTTPETDKDKVAYYVVGLAGKETTDPLERLSLVCYDKQAGTLNILEIPQDTYIDDSTLWSVNKTGSVWGNPKPVDWCEYERKRVYPEEIADGKHTPCGQPVTQKIGSASENLISIFNEQYSMPVDGFFIISQDAFVKLVDLMDGVDVNLEKEMKLGSVTYPAGVQTLAGDGALQYMLDKEEGVQGDIDRLVRQRKVMVALFQRLTATSEKSLREDSLVPLMNGSTPIRSNLTSDEMVELITSMAGITPSSMTAYVIPGEATSADKVNYYSVHRAELAALLNEAFNPYGRPITEADLQVKELASGGESDTHMQVLSEIAVDQSGAAAPETTTAAAA